MDVDIIYRLDLQPRSLRSHLLEIYEIRIAHDRPAGQAALQEIQEPLIERDYLLCLCGPAIREICRDKTKPLAQRKSIPDLKARIASDALQVLCGTRDHIRIDVIPLNIKAHQRSLDQDAAGAAKRIREDATLDPCAVDKPPAKLRMHG